MSAVYILLQKILQSELVQYLPKMADANLGTPTNMSGTVKNLVEHDSGNVVYGIARNFLSPGNKTQFFCYLLNLLKKVAFFQKF